MIWMRDLFGAEAEAIRATPEYLMQDETYTPLSKPFEKNGKTATAAIRKDKWPYVSA